MAGNKYLSLVAGRKQEVAATQVSTGAEAGAIVALDATGRLDPSVLPVGLGEEITNRTAFENLNAGDFVNVFNNAGTPSVRKADASVAGKEANGFVLSAATAATSVRVYFSGTNTQLTGLTTGTRYYLSASTPGAATATPPASTGNILQFIGVASNTTEIPFVEEDPVTLA